MTTLLRVGSSASNSFLRERKNPQPFVKPHHGQRVPLAVAEKVVPERLPFWKAESVRVEEQRLESRRGGAAVLDLQVVVAEERPEEWLPEE
jgi:hypothetical protein